MIDIKEMKNHIRLFTIEGEKVYVEKLIDRLEFELNRISKIENDIQRKMEHTTAKSKLNAYNILIERYNHKIDKFNLNKKQ